MYKIFLTHYPFQIFYLIWYHEISKTQTCYLLLILRLLYLIRIWQTELSDSVLSNNQPVNFFLTHYPFQILYLIWYHEISKTQTCCLLLILRPLYLIRIWQTELSDSVLSTNQPVNFFLTHYPFQIFYLIWYHEISKTQTCYLLLILKTSVFDTDLTNRTQRFSIIK